MSKYTDILLSVLRIMIGALYLEHGTAKMFSWPFYAPVSTHIDWTKLSSGVGGTLEVVLGTLIVIGFYTRPAAFIASGMMAVAYFMTYSPRGFFPIANGGDAAIAFCFAFLYISAAGPGSIAVNQK